MGQKNPVKVTRRNNKQQKSQQTRNRQTWSFPWGVEKALSGELGGSAPHWISDFGTRLTLPGCPVPPLREQGLGLHYPFVSPMAKSPVFWTTTSMPATGSNLFSPFVSYPGGIYSCYFCRTECLHCKNNALTSTSMEGKARKPEKWDGSVPAAILRYFVKWRN